MSTIYSVLDMEGDSPTSGSRSSGKGPESSPACRQKSNFLGLKNQGATCYLNSLVQAIFMTPEFRSGLFSISPQKLGIRHLQDVKSDTAVVEAPQQWSCDACSFLNAAEAEKCAMCETPKPPQSQEVACGDKSKRARVLPLELQHLFARLQCSDAPHTSTMRLTKYGFMWNDSQISVQQDVQELNRILFDSIERSLKGKPGSELIRNLYRGSVQYATHCCACGAVSVREEEVLDLTVPAKGNSSLVEALEKMLLPEIMNGDNQYVCGPCDGKVDATRHFQLVHLPPVIIFVIQRFDYDRKTWQRFKTTSKFEFPLQLDLRKFVHNPEEESCAVEKGETSTSQSRTVTFSSALMGAPPVWMEEGAEIEDKKHIYELTGVVIHRGGTESGHYHALLKDLMHEGVWAPPSTSNKSKKQQNKMSNKPADKNSPVPESQYKRRAMADPDSPLFVLRRILESEELDASIGLRTIKLSDIPRKLRERTGQAWTKIYKPRWQNCKHFLGHFQDEFVLTPDDLLLWTPPDGYEAAYPAGPAKSKKDTDWQTVSGKRSSGKVSAPAEPSVTGSVPSSPAIIDKEDLNAVWGRWFDFNDSSVEPASVGAITSQFQGPESAYMLVYRSCALPREGLTAPEPPMPWKSTVEEENAKLQSHWIEKDREANCLKLKVLSPSMLEYSEHLLHLLRQPSFKRSGSGETASAVEEEEATTESPDLKDVAVEIIVDRRSTAIELKEQVFAALKEVDPDLPSSLESLTVHHLKLAARSLGWHPMEEIGGLAPSSKMVTPSGDPVMVDKNVFPLSRFKLSSGDVLLAWNGTTVGGKEIPVGPEVVPVALLAVHLKTGSLTDADRVLVAADGTSEPWDQFTPSLQPHVPPMPMINFRRFTAVLPRSASVIELFSLLSERTGLPAGHIDVNAVKPAATRSSMPKVQRIPPPGTGTTYANKVTPTIASAGLVDLSEVIVESNRDPGRRATARGPKPLANEEARHRSELVGACLGADLGLIDSADLFIVDLVSEQASYTHVLTLSVHRNTSLQEVRGLALIRLGVADATGIEGGRLRSTISDAPGVLYEDEGKTLNEARIADKQKLILEPGRALVPRKGGGEIAVRVLLVEGNCKAEDGGGGSLVCEQEVVIKRVSSLLQFKAESLALASRDPSLAAKYRVRRANYTGEAGKLIERDDGVTLEQLRVINGDILWVEEGTAPIRGMMKLHLRLWCPQSVVAMRKELMQDMPRHLMGSDWGEERGKPDGWVSWFCSSVTGLFEKADGKEGAAETKAELPPPMEDDSPPPPPDPATSSGDVPPPEPPLLDSSLRLMECRALLKEKCLVTLPDITVPAKLSLIDFKTALLSDHAINSALREHGYGSLSPQQLRVRLLSRALVPAHISRVLTRNLKNNRISKNKTLVLQPMPKPENLEMSDVVLFLGRRHPDRRVTTPLLWPPLEIVVKGCTEKKAMYDDLLHVVGQKLGIPKERVVVAKLQPSSHTWKRLHPPTPPPVKAGKKRRNKRGKAWKPPALADAPYLLKDGEMIAACDAEEDPEQEDDFMRPEDHLMKELDALNSRDPSASGAPPRAGSGGKRAAGREVGVVFGGDYDFTSDEEEDSDDPEE